MPGGGSAVGGGPGITVQSCSVFFPSGAHAISSPPILAKADRYMCSVSGMPIMLRPGLWSRGCARQTSAAARLHAGTTIAGPGQRHASATCRPDRVERVGHDASSDTLRELNYRGGRSVDRFCPIATPAAPLLSAQPGRHYPSNRYHRAGHSHHHHLYQQRRSVPPRVGNCTTTRDLHTKLPSRNIAGAPLVLSATASLPNARNNNIAAVHTAGRPSIFSNMTKDMKIDTRPSSRQYSNGTSSGADGHQKSVSSSWLGHEGAAAFDLRSKFAVQDLHGSRKPVTQLHLHQNRPFRLLKTNNLLGDTMTTPTAAMLSAIQTTTLLDDVMGEDLTTISLEHHIADLTGKESGLFVLSGTMGNQLALRSLLVQPPYSVLCDHRAHIIAYEAGGVSTLTGAMTCPVIPSNGLYLTLEDIEARVVLDYGDVHSCPTRVISLENTLGGIITPLAEVQRIAAFARENGIKMHCDGARLWECVASGTQGSLRDWGACFDTLTMCFSKGLGAPIGSILVGTSSVIKHARWTRKAIGGGLRQAGVVTAAARVAVDTTFGAGPSGEGGLLRKTHDTAKRVEKMWRDVGGEMAQPVQTNMCWLDLGSMNTDGNRIQELGKEAGIKLMGNRIITHYQVGEEALARLAKVFEQVASEKDRVQQEANGGGDDHGIANGSSHRSGPYGDGTQKRNKA